MKTLIEQSDKLIEEYWKMHGAEMNRASDNYDVDVNLIPIVKKELAKKTKYKLLEAKIKTLINVCEYFIERLGPVQEMIGNMSLNEIKTQVFQDKIKSISIQDFWHEYKDIEELITKLKYILK